MKQAPTDEGERRALLAGDLRNFEARIHSQNGEDGILREILDRIGRGPRYFVEFGAESGLECNCAHLVLEESWSRLFMEADATLFAELRARFTGHAGVRCIRATVTSRNIEELLAANDVPREFDVLSIDIDGNDYWTWAALEAWRPRIVVIEYNASYPPPARWVMKENPSHRWDGTRYFGASLTSLAALGERKGYALVTTNSTGVNAFFVRDDLVGEGAFPDADVQYHYSPPTYGACCGGHPLGEGPFEEL